MNYYQKIIKILDERNWKSLITEEMYKNNRTKFDVSCDNNHSWETCLFNLMNSENCRQCWNNLRIIKINGYKKL